MINLKVSGIIAIAAFVLSFILGLIGRTTMPMLFLRPVIFAVLFFVISGAVKLLVSRFLPELLEDDDDFSSVRPGTRVNITEGDTAGFAQDYSGQDPALGGDFAGTGAPAPAAPKPSFTGAQADDSEEGLGNISDLIENGSGFRAQGGIDQNTQDGYNADGGMGGFSASDPAGSLGSGTASKAPSGGSHQYGSMAPGTDDDFSGSVEILPDLDSMAGAFRETSSNEEESTTEYSTSAPERKPLSSGKAPSWSGDFSAKDMAKGLQTILSKDKEG